MAGLAVAAIVVLLGDDLRKALWFGGVCFMANDTELARHGQCRFDLVAVFGMCRLRPVTGFASDAGVLARLEDREHFVVAHGAGFAASVGDGTGSDVSQGSFTKVAVLAESGGDDLLPNNREGDTSDGEQQYQSENVARVFHQGLLSCTGDEQMNGQIGE
ncbi:MAG: hypothetical protein ABI972_15630 [Acidobacteriota bacterium]